jgi:RNA polymerase sigma factor (sigma-70 family)
MVYTDDEMANALANRERIARERTERRSEVKTDILDWDLYILIARSLVNDIPKDDRWEVAQTIILALAKAQRKSESKLSRTKLNFIAKDELTKYWRRIYAERELRIPLPESELIIHSEVASTTTPKASKTQKKQVTKLLKELSERERLIIRLYYGLDGKRLTFREIAEYLGISHVRVYKIYNEAILKMGKES